MKNKIILSFDNPFTECDETLLINIWDSLILGYSRDFIRNKMIDDKSEIVQKLNTMVKSVKITKVREKDL